MWELIYTHLKNNGIDVYSPGQHKGDCINPYTVVKNNGSTQVLGISSEVVYYDILMYVPEAHYSQLEPYVQKIRLLMKELYPTITDAHYESPVVIDSEIKAYMVSKQYQNYVKFHNKY